MYPAIAKIVSDCFYSTIGTNEKAEKRYRNETLPFQFSDARLSERPCFIDMPLSREIIGYRGGDRSNRGLIATE
jgi:hypothetical protein